MSSQGQLSTPSRASFREIKTSSFLVWKTQRGVSKHKTHHHYRCVHRGVCRPSRQYLFEDAARIPVEVEYASGFRYRNPVIGSDDVVIAISQSGEAADTLAAVKLAKEAGAFVFGICNVVGSSLLVLPNTGAYTHAGPEIGVASTRTFTTQITILMLIGLRLGQLKSTLSSEDFVRVAAEL